MSKTRMFYSIFVLLISFSFAAAQDSFNDDIQPPNRNRQRPNLLRELNLSQEQVREIRRINQTNRQDLRAAQQRVAETRRDLDQAIYSETADEAVIKQKLRDFQEAQAEIARIRAFTEYSIRKILTPEQLIRFRELRQNFEQFRRERRKNLSPNRMRNQRRRARQLPPGNR